ncbi:MAG: hypothetical protein IV100_08030 [Myxococcales bacterium]|nr:hypothetical protein [Myxococcales bacterium]
MRPSTRVLLHLAVSSLLACGKTGGGGGGGDDDIESAILSGLDEAALITEAELDQEFPLVDPVDPAEDDDTAPDPTLSDPTAGGALEARFAAFTASRTADGLFAVPAVEGVPAEFNATVTRGILFGLDHFAARLPDFDVYAAVAARPFVVTIFTAAKPITGFRASVASCPNKPADWNACQPAVNIPYEVVNGVVKPVRAATYVHEMGHLGHVLYTLSTAYQAAGGLALGSFRHNEFRWQREGSAQFLTARAPDWAAYDRLGAQECAFKALQAGAFAWKDFSPSGNAIVLPYQMSLLVDQVSWFHYSGGTSWLLDWWIARPDARDRARPESAARSLMRLLSPSSSATDLSALNQLIVRAGIDLYVRGRNPWTTRTLTADCFDPAGATLTATTPGSATVSVPAIGFRAVAMPVAPDALDTVSALQLTLTSDRPAVRAAVYAIARTEYVACVGALTGGVLGTESPRKACNEAHALPLGPLQASNGYRALIKLTPDLKSKLTGKDLVAVLFHPWTTGAPRTPATITFTAGPPGPTDLTVTLRNASSEDHVHFELTSNGNTVTVDRGQTGSLVFSGAKAGDQLPFNVEKPGDFGPTFAGSATCVVTDAPNNPTVTYSGSVTCSGF